MRVEVTRVLGADCVRDRWRHLPATGKVQTPLFRSFVTCPIDLSSTCRTAVVVEYNKSATNPRRWSLGLTDLFFFR